MNAVSTNRALGGPRDQVAGWRWGGRGQCPIPGATLGAGQSVTHRLEPGRRAYLVGALGRFKVNGVEAKARDGVVVRDAEAVTVEALGGSEILLADLPGGR